METKICIECGIEKDISEFEFRNDTKKYRNQCKECCKKRAHKYHLEHKEKRNAYNREYYKSNKEAFSEKAKIYREEHKEELKKANKEWRDKNTERISENNKKYRNENSEKLKAYSKDYYKKNKEMWKEYYSEYNQFNSERIKNQQKEWRDSHRQYLNEYAKKYNRTRKEVDEIFYFKNRVRGLINKSFRRRKYDKKKRTEEILGCDFEFFTNICYKHLKIITDMSGTELRT